MQYVYGIIIVRGKGMRTFHTSRHLRKLSLTASKSSVPIEIVSSAQKLRLSLNSGNDDTVHNLKDLANALKDINSKVEIPPSVYKLMKKTLQQNDLKLNFTDLQLLYKVALPPTNPDLELVTLLYSKLHRNANVSYEQKLENGKIYFRLLIENNKLTEANRLGEILLKRAPADFVLEILNLVELNLTKEGVLSVIKGSHASNTAVPVLTKAIELLLKLKSTDGLDEMVDFLYFTNAHYEIPESIDIILLDAYLQLPLGDGGFNLLKHCLGRWVSNSNNKPNIETLELLLMACIHFQAQDKIAELVANKITSNFAESEYSKETWDVLAQFTIYTSNPKDMLQKLKLKDPDSHTLVAALIAAEKAGFCKDDINVLVKHFVDLGVSLDAFVYEVLIRISLNTNDVDHARTLFIESNCEWGENPGVLNNLLIQLCKTPSIDRQLVINCYDRIKFFIPKISYEAQTAMLEMLLHNSSLELVGVFMAEQFGECPDLPFKENKKIFELIYHKLLFTDNEELASELCVLLNTAIVLPYSAYYPICLKMCSLNRVDVAHLFFRQMRNRAKQGLIEPPGDEIYKMLLTEYAIHKYELGIFELDTYFRLDINNEMSIPIMNRIMAGYASLGDSHKMANLWTEVCCLPKGTEHGPNAETLTIWMHFIYQQMPLETVDDVWMSLPEFKVEVTESLLKQYIIANCYHGYYSRALELVKAAPEQYKIPVTEDLLATVYNWTLLENRKENVKEFALENYKEEWGNLEAKNKLKNVLLPAQNAWGETDEPSRRWEAIRELQSTNDLIPLLR